MWASIGDFTETTAVLTTVSVFLFSQTLTTGGGAGIIFAADSSLWAGDTGLRGSSFTSSPPENTSCEWFELSLSLRGLPGDVTGGGPKKHNNTPKTLNCQSCHMSSSKWCKTMLKKTKQKTGKK